MGNKKHATWEGWGMAHEGTDDKTPRMEHVPQDTEARELRRRRKVLSEGEMKVFAAAFGQVHASQVGGYSKSEELRSASMRAAIAGFAAVNALRAAERDIRASKTERPGDAELHDMLAQMVDMEPS